MAKPNNTGFDSSIRYFALLLGALCLVGVAVSLVHKALPVLQLLVPVAIGWWLWQRHHKRQKRQQKTLNTAFYQLLRKHQGRMTLLDFAMTTEITAIAARQYLDSRAKEFAARFDVTEQGDVIYVFSTLTFPRLPSSSAAIAAPSDHNPLPLPASLTQVELAKRLGVAAKTVSRKKLSSDLTNWTQHRDPDSIGWSYLASERRFFPAATAVVATANRHTSSAPLTTSEDEP